jgi:hypothetical protein
MRYILKDLIDKFKTAIVIFSDDGKIILSNEAMADVFFEEDEEEQSEINPRNP